MTTNFVATRCKKCGGNLYRERDIDGLTLVCLQCSTIHSKHGELLRHRAKAGEIPSMRFRIASRSLA